MLSLQDRIDDAASDEMAFFNQKRMHRRLANQLQAQSDAAKDVVDREKFRRAADEQRKRYAAAARNEWRATLKLRELMDEQISETPIQCLFDRMLGNPLRRFPVINREEA